MCVYMLVCIVIPFLSGHVCVHAGVHCYTIFEWTQGSRATECQLGMCVCMYVCMHVCVHNPLIVCVDLRQQSR